MANKLAERLANRQGVRIDAPDPAPPGDDPPETHRDKLAAGWKRVVTVLPPGEHQAFKIAALRADREMSDVVRDLINNWLKTQT